MRRILVPLLCGVFALTATVSHRPAEAESLPPLTADCIAKNNLGEKATDFISRCRKASIRRVFPGEFLEATLGEIKAAADAGNARAKAAWKLLSRHREDKDALPPAISPLSQATMGEEGTAFWTVTVDRDPEYSDTLRVEFKDGSRGYFFIPAGSGVEEVYVSHNYGEVLGGWWHAEFFMDEEVIGGVELPAGEITYAVVYHGCA